MGRYLINMSRLDMSLVIKALEDLRDKQVENMDNKTYRETIVLIDILKNERDNCDPALDLVYKN